MSASPERPAEPPPNRAARPRHPDRESVGRGYCGVPEAARYLDVSEKTIRKAIPLRAFENNQFRSVAKATPDGGLLLGRVVPARLGRVWCRRG